MTKYLSSDPFSVHLSGDGYAEGWERIFGRGDSLDPTDDTPCPEDCMICRDAIAPYEAIPTIKPLQEQVEDFHRAFDQPIIDVPSVPEDERVKLRLRLIAEEFFELLAACDVDHGMYYDESRMRPMGPVDLVEVADALGDLDYVIEGTRLEFGLNAGPIAAEIHRSNMAKLVDGKPVKNAAGKVVKPAGWTPPDIAGVLKRQGWKGA